MPVDQGLAHLSDGLLFVVTIGYSLAMLLFGAEYAYGRRGRVARVVQTVAAREHERIEQPQLVGSGAVAPPEVPAYLTGPPTVVAPVRGDSVGRAARVGQGAVVLTGLAWGLHLASLVARGLSVGRVPWGNMYEFSSSFAFAAVTAFLVLLTRQRVRWLGVFVLVPVVLGLGLASTVLYAPADPLVPALQSYWITIHVTAAILSFGIFTVSAVVSALFLLRRRFEARVQAAGSASGVSGVGRMLPDAATLDRVAYRTLAFAFPIWTFAIIAGAIWAEAAWGRFWGWDPKETWAFISWVAYAAYLHARATAGWKGSRAAGVALVAYGTMVFNYFAINMWVAGLHSYAGVK